MIRIILILLSIIGIILAILLTLIFLILFVPVRYRAYGRRKEDLYGEGHVTWLLHLLHILAVYEKGELRFELRVFGYPLIRKREPLEEAEEEIKDTAEDMAQEAEPEVIAMERRLPEAEADLESEEERTPGKETGADGEDTRKKEKPRKGRTQKEKRGKTDNLLGNIRRLLELVKQFWEENKEAFGIIWKKLGKFLKALLPDRMEGSLWYGTSDPCTTGQLTGFLAVFYGFYGDKINLYPDFTQAVFRGELFISGKIRIFTFVHLCITLILDRRVRQLITNIRNLKEDF